MAKLRLLLKTEGKVMVFAEDIAPEVEMLAAEGAEAEVVDLRTLVPLDEETLVRSVKKTGRVVVAHEAQQTRETTRPVAARNRGSGRRGHGSGLPRDG